MSAQHGFQGDGVDIFLSIRCKRAGKIKGEGTTAGHEDDIEVYGWTWGVAAASAIGSTQATAKRSYRPLVVNKAIDSASVGLLSALVTNDEVKEAVLTMRKAGGTAIDYCTITLAGARIVDIAVDVDARGRPVEKVSMAFTKVDVQYKRQQPVGGSGGAYSFSDEILPQ